MDKKVFIALFLSACCAILLALLYQYHEINIDFGAARKAFNDFIQRQEKYQYVLLG